MEKYCFTYFWNTEDNQIEFIYVNVLVNGLLTESEVNAYAEDVFQNNMVQLGYSQKQIDKADYQLAVSKGWCGV